MTRRLRRVPITPDLLVEMMKHGMEAIAVVEHALPEDARYVGSTFDPWAVAVSLLVESRSQTIPL